MALRGTVDITPRTRYTGYDFPAPKGGHVTGLEVDHDLTLSIGIYDDAEKYAALGLLIDELEQLRKGIGARIAAAAIGPEWTESDMAAAWGR